MSAQIRKKTKGGYAAESVMLGPEPKQAGVERARQGALHDVDPRYRGHRRVERAIFEHAPERLDKMFRAGEVGVDVQRPPVDDEPSSSLLRVAAWSEDSRLLEVFLRHGAPPDGYGASERPLLAAASAGRLENAKLLLDAGADVNARGSRGQTALSACVHWGGGPMAKLLIERGADVELSDEEGKTALIEAIDAGMGNVIVVRVLLEAGADPNKADARGRTPLQRCRRRGRHVKGMYAEIEQLLREAGANEATRSAPLDELLSLLERLDLPMNARRVPGDLSEAAAAGDADVVRLFLADGQDPDRDYRDGWYPLQRAARFGRDEVIQVLRDAGAEERALPERKPNPIGEKVVAAVAMVMTSVPGFDPRAADVDRLEGQQREDAALRCAQLVRKGALSAQEDVRIFERPILAYASGNGLTELVDALLQDGADPNQEGGSLEAAASNGFNECVRLLLAAGADPNLGAPAGEREPLHSAAARGDLELVRLLVESGAELRASSGVGQTSCTVARGPQRNAVRRYLRAQLQERIERSRRHSVRFVRRKRMYDRPEARSGPAAYRAYRPQNRLGFVRCPIEEVAEALAVSFDYERDVAKHALIGVQEGAFVFQQTHMTWTVISGIGLGGRRLRSILRSLATTLGVDSAFYQAVPTRLEIMGAAPEQMQTDQKVDDFFERERLWVLPHYVDGDGIYDDGFENRLLFKGVQRQDVLRVDRFVLTP